MSHPDDVLIHPKAPGLPLGITRAMVTELVHTFYGKVRADAVLGPIFERRITNWAPHLEKLVRFWCSISLMTGEYHGRPMPAHMNLGIVPDHFGRWLGLWTETANEVCPPPAAAFFIERAHLIARSLQLGIGLVDPLTNRPRDSIS